MPAPSTAAVCLVSGPSHMEERGGLDRSLLPWWRSRCRTGRWWRWSAALQSILSRSSTGFGIACRQPAPRTIAVSARRCVDRRFFRRFDPVEVMELREWTRIAEDLTVERLRLTNRMRQQLWRPQFLKLTATSPRNGSSTCSRRPPAKARRGRPSNASSRAIACGRSAPARHSGSCASQRFPSRRERHCRPERR